MQMVAVLIDIRKQDSSYSMLHLKVPRIFDRAND